ncbi:hypothetical protein L9F63_019466, partial [Diploptera punctata]
RESERKDYRVCGTIELFCSVLTHAIQKAAVCFLYVFTINVSYLSNFLILFNPCFMSMAVQKMMLTMKFQQRNFV